MDAAEDAAKNPAGGGCDTRRRESKPSTVSGRTVKKMAKSKNNGIPYNYNPAMPRNPHGGGKEPTGPLPPVSDRGGWRKPNGKPGSGPAGSGPARPSGPLPPYRGGWGG